MKTDLTTLINIHCADHTDVKASLLYLKQRQQQMFKQPHSPVCSQACLCPTPLGTVIDSLESKIYLRETEEP